MKKTTLTGVRFFSTRIVYFLMCFCALTLTSCSDDYDDTEIKNSIASLEQRVAALEAWCTTVNSELSSLQTLIEALDARDYITNIQEIDGGYSITFAYRGTITLYNGETPVISVALHTDGKYYWTIQSGSEETKWLTDTDGNMICATGETGAAGADGADGTNAPTPQLKMGSELGSSYDQTAIYLSVDGGTTWIKVSGDKGEAGASGSDGANGTDGVDGTSAPTPILGLASDLVDAGYDLGSDYIATAVYLSVDGGTTWMKVSGDKGETGISGNLNYIEEDANGNVVIGLTNGTTFTVPYAPELLDIEVDNTSANTFIVTSPLLSDRTGNVVDIRVESENADGTAIIVCSAIDTRWSVESSITGNVLTITAKPANTVELNETALLKVIISNRAGKILASGQEVFANRYLNAHQVIVRTEEELKTAILDDTINYIELADDITLTNSLSISSYKDINLDNYILSSSIDGQTVLSIEEGTACFSNGTIEFGNTYNGGNKTDIAVGVDKSHDANKSDEVVSVATAIFNSVTLAGSIYVSYGSEVIVSESEINSELYGICTNANASTATTQPISVTITDTKMTGETPIFINVPATLTMDNCNIIGGWQGVMMRGGTATISNSTISLKEGYATPVEGTGWAKDRRTGTAWGSGNEVAIAGITMGNNTTNAYQYPTSVTLMNTSVSGYEGYWAVYADATNVCTVDFMYDSSCTFSPALDADKSFKQGIGAGNDYISVTDGTGTTTRF